MIAASLRKYLLPEIAVLVENLLVVVAEGIPDFEDQEHARGWALEQTQRQWLRHSQKERWELMPDSSLSVDVLELLEGSILLKEQGVPTSGVEDVLLMSAVEPVFLQRLDYFSNLVQRGLSFNRIFLLGGERQLDSEHESGALRALGAGATEIDMLLYHAEKLQASALHLENVDFIKCTTPCVETESGGVRRPNTLDTVMTWRDEFFEDGSVLCLTNQPFVHYQAAVIASALGRDAKILAAGSAACLHEINPAIVLDALARLIYTALPTSK